jgi:hypothetical protein
MVQALAVYEIVKIFNQEGLFRPLTGYKKVENEMNLMVEDDEIDLQK